MASCAIAWYTVLSTTSIANLLIAREQRSRVSLQFRLSGGGRSQVRTVLLGKFPKTGENTGNFADLCRL